jgi:hypothetical protein
MESTYYTFENINYCLKMRMKSSVVVFIHDVQRTMETILVKKYFANSEILFILPDKRGTLLAVRISNPIVVNDNLIKF